MYYKNNNASLGRQGQYWNIVSVLLLRTIYIATTTLHLQLRCSFTIQNPKIALEWHTTCYHLSRHPIRETPSNPTYRFQLEYQHKNNNGITCVRV